MIRVSIGAVFIVLVLSWPAMPASAEDSVALETRTSVCVNPATPPRTAHSVEEQKAFRECLEWSRFAAAISIVERDDFAQCQGGTQMSDKTLPLRQFLDQVLYAYHQKQPSEKPVTETILRSPSKFGLRLVRAGESRFGSLMVWPGSAGLVVDDRNEPNAVAVSLQKLVLLYPSTAKCGTLELITADKLVPQATGGAGVRYFHPTNPRLFWNSWIADERGGEQPEFLRAGAVYHLRLAFAALDFKAQKDGNDAGNRPVAPQQVADYLPQLEPYNITIVPIGKFLGNKTHLSLVDINPDILARTLTQNRITGRTYDDLSKEHNAIKVLDGPDVLSSLFIPAEPGCISFVVVVTTQSTRRVVTSWRVNARVGDQDAASCAVTPVSRQVGPAAMPSFQLADEPNALARLAFVDFGDFSIGTFQKALDADQDPVSWALRVPLGTTLRDLSEYVNDSIGSDDLDLKLVSRELTKALFDCDGDDDCDGNIALQELRALARASPNGRVQVNVRNVVTNTNYYLPIQLVGFSESELLGQYLDFVQPLPIPLPPVSGATKCVRDWTSGLIVTDGTFPEDWRSALVPAMIKPLNHQRFAALDNLGLLKSYFTSTMQACERPEALVLVAHHGRGFLADTPLRKRIEGIPAEQVAHKFKNGSVGILMACSIGAIGDPQNDGASFLERMNEKNMRAAIISPVNVPGRLATRFLENMKVVTSSMETDTKLSEILRRARQRMLNGPDLEDNNESIRIASNFLMVVGDPDASICGVIK